MCAKTYKHRKSSQYDTTESVRERRGAAVRGVGIGTTSRHKQA